MAATTVTEATDRLMTEILTIVQQLPDADAVTARGAAMTRDEIVAFAVESLDDPS